jgi:Mg2+/Co2+ transporter CorB
LAQGEAGGGGVTTSQVLLLALLLLLSGLMSGSETALTALGDWKLRQLRESGQDPHGLFAQLEATPPASSPPC